MKRGIVFFLAVSAVLLASVVVAVVVFTAFAGR
jgi:hypothetical protein